MGSTYSLKDVDIGIPTVQSVSDKGMGFKNHIKQKSWFNLCLSVGKWKKKYFKMSSYYHKAKVFLAGFQQLLLFLLFCSITFFVWVFCLYVWFVFPVIKKPEEGIGSLRTGVTEGCKPSCVYWVSNLGPLGDQPVLLTTELFLQFPGSLFK